MAVAARWLKGIQTKEVEELLRSCRGRADGGGGKVSKKKPLGSSSSSSSSSSGASTMASASNEQDSSTSPSISLCDNLDRQVDLHGNHLAIAANRGFAVYVLDLSVKETTTTSKGKAAARLLSRHEFSQVKTLRFAQTSSSSVSKDKDVQTHLIVIQEDGEVTVWNSTQSAFEERHRWQMVNRIPPKQGQIQTLSHAILTCQNRLTILCLNQMKHQQHQHQQPFLNLEKVILEKIDVVVNRTDEQDGDLSPRHRKKAVTEQLGEILAADSLLCPTSGTPRSLEWTELHFWILSSKRRIAFLWNLKTKRCLRKVNLPGDAIHFCVHNPTGGLLWITHAGNVCIHKCSGLETSHSGSPASGDLLSHLQPVLPSNEEVVRTLSIGPFLWIATTPVIHKMHQKQIITVFAFHAMSGCCVGRQSLTPRTLETGGGGGGSEPSQCNLLIQTNSLSTFLVSTGGNSYGIWKCQLKVPAAMDSVLATILNRVNSTHDTGGRNRSCKPSVEDDLRLLGHILSSELSAWGNVLQQQKVDAQIARMELSAKLCGFEEIKQNLNKTFAVPALFAQFRTQKGELGKIFKMLSERDAEVEGKDKFYLPEPKKPINTYAREMLKKFLDQNQERDSEWNPSVCIMESSNSSSYYHENSRVRLCLYFFQEVVSVSMRKKRGKGQVDGIREVQEVFCWLAQNLSSASALRDLEDKLDVRSICNFAQEIADLCVENQVNEKERENCLHLSIAFEISCLMLYLVVPNLLIDFVLTYGKTVADKESKTGESQNELVRDFAFRAACVLPALHIHDAGESYPTQLSDAQVQAQARLYCMAGHPLCALHILCSLESVATETSAQNELDVKSFQKIIQLFSWMRKTDIVGKGSTDDFQVLSILVEHVVIKMLRSKHQQLHSEAGLLLHTLSLEKDDPGSPSKSDETSLDRVVEGIIQESISSLHSEIVL